MPVAIVFTYFILEILAFAVVTQWLGVINTFGLLLLSFVFGMVVAGIQARKQLNQISASTTPADSAAEFGFTATGAFLLALPGFVSSFLGLLLFFPPTRRLVRKSLAKWVRSFLENIAVRGFNTARFPGKPAFHGTFASAHSDSEPQVIDHEDIETWANTINPEDFRDDASGR